MKVILDPKAVKFIKSKGSDAITLWLEGCSSWGVGEPQPSVRMGKPEEDLDDFDRYDSEGIEVYVRVDVQAKNDELNVKHSKLLWNEKLIVEGMLF